VGREASVDDEGEGHCIFVASSALHGCSPFYGWLWS
jgi:hypothetical protein